MKPISDIEVVLGRENYELKDASALMCRPIKASISFSDNLLVWLPVYLEGSNWSVVEQVTVVAVVGGHPRKELLLKKSFTSVQCHFLLEIALILFVSHSHGKKN